MSNKKRWHEMMEIDDNVGQQMSGKEEDGEKKLQRESALFVERGGGKRGKKSKTYPKLNCTKSV